ncbi:NUDIX domain-containing protein [Patescibacteria group bacterium]|nr:NUDIX domain-containing protein [Patescibacteria group bacterium]
MEKLYIKKKLPKLLIMEGFWQVGKTQLIAALAKKFHFEIIYEPNHIYSNINTDISKWYQGKHQERFKKVQNNMQNGKKIIMDRSIISSIAYQYATSGKFPNGYKSDLYRIKKTNSFLVIFLYGDKSFVIKKSKKIKDNTVKNQMKKSSLFYDNYLDFYLNILPSLINNRILFIKVNNKNKFIGYSTIFKEANKGIIGMLKTKAVCASVVMFYKNKILLLYDHKWKHYVLPQGHKENKEVLKNTALREASEETGFKNLKVVKKLKKYQYHYSENNKIIYKTIHVYLVEILNPSKTKRKLEPHEKYSNNFFKTNEAIKKARWPQDKKVIALSKNYIK